MGSNRNCGHESGVFLVLLADSFLERGLVLLAFESHLVITLLKFSLANKKSRLFFCRTLIRRPSSKQSALMFLYKKAHRFSTCTLDWLCIEFSWNRGERLEQGLSTRVHYQKHPKNARWHLRSVSFIFWPLKCREAPTVGASRGWHLFYAPFLAES